MSQRFFSTPAAGPSLLAALLLSACNDGRAPALELATSETRLALTPTPIQYGYDAAGRLVAVYDPNGNSAQYSYDEAGNILGITRVSSGALAIVSFAPVIGPPGSTVTLLGSGFSATAANNVVRFNGVAAAVQAASVQQLVVTVPASATTGKLSVAVGANTATSNGNFTIGDGAPSITSFSPTFGNYNSVVTLTVNGSGFDPNVGNNSLSVGNKFEQVTTATPAQLKTLSFQAQTSGPVQVTTHFGTASGAKDFFVLPPGTTSANVGFTGRIAVDGNSLAVTASPNTTAFVLFDANPNDNIGVGLTQVDLGGAPSVQAVVTDPNNLIVSQFIVADSTTSQLPTLAVRATYLFALQPGIGATSPLKATLTLTRAVTGTISIGGGATSFVSVRPGQQAMYSFAATSGQHLALTLLGVTFTNGLSAQIMDGNNNLVTSVIASQNQNTALDVPVLAAGTYQLVLSPINGGTGQVQFQLASDASGSAGTVGGTATTLTLAKSQHGIYTFPGNANALVGLGIPSITTSPAGAQVVLTVLDPNGNQLTMCSVTGASSCALPKLPATGNYTLAVAPDAGASATLQVLLSQYLTGTVTAGGAAVLFSSTRIGQGGLYTFSATAGQNLSIAGGNCTFPSGVTITVLDVNGNIVGILSPAPNSDASADLVGLSAGTYSISVSPISGGLGQVTLQLIKDASGSAGTVGGNTTTLSLASNQHGRYTFSGTANEVIGLGFSALTTNPASAFVSIQVMDALGEIVTDCSASSPGNCQLSPLPTTGTYTVAISPPARTSATLQLVLSQYLSGSITSGGATVVYTTSRVGQGATYSFTTTASKSLTLNLSACTFADGVNVQVLDVSGSIVATVTEFQGQTQALSLTNLPAGTYRVWLIPSDVSVGTMSIALH